MIKFHWSIVAKPLSVIVTYVQSINFNSTPSIWHRHVRYTNSEDWLSYRIFRHYFFFIRDPLLCAIPVRGLYTFFGASIFLYMHFSRLPNYWKQAMPEAQQLPHDANININFTTSFSIYTLFVETYIFTSTNVSLNELTPSHFFSNKVKIRHKRSLWNRQGRCLNRDKWKPWGSGVVWHRYFGSAQVPTNMIKVTVQPPSPQEFSIIWVASVLVFRSRFKLYLIRQSGSKMLIYIHCKLQ